MEATWQDIKFASRGLRNNLGFAAAAIFALALGIGANTAIFSVLNAVLLHPLVFKHLRDPSHLVMVWEKNPALSLFFANRMPPRLRTYKSWKEQSRAFEDLAAWSQGSAILTNSGGPGGTKPEQVSTGSASANFFPLLGVRPHLGRSFTKEEMLRGKEPVVIVSDQIWKSRFNGDPAILGRTLTVNSNAYRIIGVLPADFSLPAVWGGSDEKHVAVWMPLDLNPPGKAQDAFSTNVFGRLKPGVSLESARAEMNLVGARIAYSDRENYAGFGVNVNSISEEDVSPELRQALFVLQAAVLFVLLIACANVGNLLLSRAVARDKEMAVRSALGASGWRIVRQTITESLLLSIIGAVFGLLISYWGLHLITAFAPPDIHGLHELRIDGSVFAFTAIVAVLAGILFGLAPASRTLKQNVNEVLNRSARSVTGSSNRLRAALAVVEVSLSLMLLIGAGLMIRSLGHLLSTDLGFRRDHLLVMRVTLPETRYSKAEQVATFNHRLIESLRQVPGVQAAALTNALPMKSVNQSSFEIPGKTFKAGAMPVSDWARMTDGYFETLQMKLIRGRTFTRQEAVAAEPNVAVVNQAFASKYFAHEDPIDKVFLFANEKGGDKDGTTKYRIVGEVNDEHQMGPDTRQHAEVYLPGDHLQSILLVARTTGDPLSMASTVKQQIWNIDKQQPVTEVGTEESALSEWLAPRRFNMSILLYFAALALLLSAVGLYSVLAYLVTLRTREIGIRMALGAEAREVAALVVKQGLRITLIGIVIGLAGAFALTRFMASLIYGISTTDVLTFVFVPVILIAISVAASYLPAFRAARIDPIEALRTE
jgi:putative ABC transport system permease protein